MIVAIGADHAGFEYKQKLIEFLISEGYSVKDVGCNSPDATDYPVYADFVCNAISCREADFGILICGTGIGMSIAANKHQGIRAAVCGDIKSAELTRQHNNANILCMGEEIIGFTTAREITKVFLSNKFVGGKHKRRLDMIDDLKKK